MELLKRTWAEVSLDALQHNYNLVRERISSQCRVMGVVKADAYGHGAVPVSRALVEFGAEYLAVSNLEEAVQLRRNGICTPLLIFGYTPSCFAQDMVRLNITQEVHSLEYAMQLNEALSGTEDYLNIHLKLDTGMSRIGFSANDDTVLREAICAAKLSHLHVEGAFTHFSVSDSTASGNVEYTQQQYALFCRALGFLADGGVEPELRHCCNSGAIITHPEYAMDMVRPGIMTYGYAPSADTSDILDLRPVLSLHTTVSQLRDLPAGTDIGYGRCFRTARDSQIAVLSVGYADGLSRILSGKIDFIINGKKAPQVGTICMDACMVDVSEIPGVRPGTEAVLIGKNGDLSQWADQLAAVCGTISYEFLCDIGKRVTRFYRQNGDITEVLQYIV